MTLLPHRMKAAALALALVLSLPSGVAAAPPSASPRPASTQLSSSRLQTSIWSWLRSVWAKEGCIIDPNGKPACSPRNGGNPAPAAPSSIADAGCIIDPDGGPCGRQ